MDSNNNHKTLIVICGPTASGKTSLAIETALKLNTEIISADSRQFFKELSIGTAKPTDKELSLVKHHFINSLSITENYSAGDFEKDGLNLLDKLFEEKDQVVLVGGSGLYIKAICEGFDDLPKPKPGTREALNNEFETNGLASLADRLRLLDPKYSETVDLNNKQRVIRALEVIESSGQKFSELRKKSKAKRPFEIKKYAIDWPRETLYNRINERVDEMLKIGLEDEVKSLASQKELNALQTVGYSEMFDLFDQKIDREEAIRLIKRNTRRFAKRQLTWYRRDTEINWLKPGEHIVNL